jgi:hypothetical protein
VCLPLVIRLIAVSPLLENIGFNRCLLGDLELSQLTLEGLKKSKSNRIANISLMTDYTISLNSDSFPSYLKINRQISHLNLKDCKDLAKNGGLNMILDALDENPVFSNLDLHGVDLSQEEVQKRLISFARFRTSLNTLVVLLKISEKSSPVVTSVQSQQVFFHHLKTLLVDVVCKVF